MLATTMWAVRRMVKTMRFNAPPFGGGASSRLLRLRSRSAFQRGWVGGRSVPILAVDRKRSLYRGPHAALPRAYFRRCFSRNASGCSRAYRRSLQSRETQQPTSSPLKLLTTLNARQRRRSHPPPLVVAIAVLVRVSLAATVQHSRRQLCSPDRSSQLRRNRGNRKPPVATRARLLPIKEPMPLSRHPYTRRFSAPNVSRQELAG
jgi:hypothetical protein